MPYQAENNQQLWKCRLIFVSLICLWVSKVIRSFPSQLRKIMPVFPLFPGISARRTLPSKAQGMSIGYGAGKRIWVRAVEGCICLHRQSFASDCATIPVLQGLWKTWLMTCKFTLEISCWRSSPPRIKPNYSANCCQRLIKCTPFSVCSVWKSSHGSIGRGGLCHLP